MKDIAQLGSSVATSGVGRIFAIGIREARNRRGATGAVFLFDRNENPKFQPLIIYGSGAGDEFGNAVAMSRDGQRIAIGAPHEEGAAGSVRVFGFSDGIWTQMGDTIRGQQPNDMLGYSLSLSGSGNVVAVCSPRGGGDNRGSVSVFKWSTDMGWGQIGQTIKGEFNDNDGIAGSVSLTYEGTTMVIGFAKASSYGKEKNGRVTTYNFQNSVWIPFGLDLLGETNGDNFGTSVAFSGDGARLVIGVPRYDFDTTITDSGYCGVYEWTDSLDDWTMFALVAGEEANERSGSSAAVSFYGTHMACGGIYGLFNSEVSGVVRVLEIENNVLSTVFPRYDEGITSTSGSTFGFSVSITDFGEALIVGAPSTTVNEEASVGCAQVFTI